MLSEGPPQQIERSWAVVGRTTPAPRCADWCGDVPRGAQSDPLRRLPAQLHHRHVICRNCWISGTMISGASSWL